MQNWDKNIKLLSLDNEEHDNKKQIKRHLKLFIKEHSMLAHDKIQLYQLKF